MTRQHELYVLDRFDEYVATHLKKLMINSPDNAIDFGKEICRTFIGWHAIRHHR